MPEAVIVDAVRTPIGRAFKGSLAQLRPDDMGAFVVDKLLERNPDVSPEMIEEVLCGRRDAAGPAGVQHGPDRRAAVGEASDRRRRRDRLALLRLEPGVDPARRELRPGRPGRRLHRRGRRMGEPLQRAHRGRGRADQNEKLQGKNGQPNAYIAMGLTAENVADKYEVSRADMDKYAQRSQELAVASQESGFLRPRDRPGRAARRNAGRQGRRAARQLDAREAVAAAARLPGGRQGHGGQLLSAQRRRGGGARDVGGQGQGARAAAARADRHRRHRRHSSRS